MQKTKNLSVVTKKAIKFRHASTHAKFSSSKVHRKNNKLEKKLSQISKI
jgi:hypothetical protein